MVKKYDGVNEATRSGRRAGGIARLWLWAHSVSVCVIWGVVLFVAVPTVQYWPGTGSAVSTTAPPPLLLNRA